MTRLLRTDSLAFLTIWLAACAASPIVDGAGGEGNEVDSGLESIEGTTPEASDDEPGVDSNAGLGGAPSTAPSGASSGGTPTPDAAASRTADAGGPLHDAGTKRAEEKDASLSSSGAKDAGVKDAGATPAAPADSGASSTPTPARDAGQTAPKPAAGTCRTASDCTASCVPLGIINCCRANGTCGCTWAPGAYCE